jgi:hypothetical protein
VGEGLRCGGVFVWKGGFAWGLNDEALRASRAGKVESMAYGAFKNWGFPFVSRVHGKQIPFYYACRFT